ncbi:hypothetical protein WJX72_007196 [[Myrmecia] bisecta]|uniref:RAP domain-containing protein n=1 Tax=[Myrmecia] bisecta TaxID=41462 RepID=A0AAW1QAY5_9CHLO
MAVKASQKLGEFSAQNISNTALSYAKLEHNPGELLDIIARETLAKLATFTPQALSNTVWAFAKLEVLNVQLMDAVAKEALRKLYSFNAQNIANTVWAYANLGYESPALFDAIGVEAQRSMERFSPQNVSNTLWAYAKVNKQMPSLFELAARHATFSMQTFQPQSMANMMWAFATLYCLPDERFITSLCAHALALLSDFSPQNISNTIWALGTLKYRNADALMHAVACEMVKRLRSGEAEKAFSRQHLANTLWGYATLDCDPGQDMLSTLADAMARRAGECNPQEVSNTVWAFAKLGHYNEALMDTFAREAESRIWEFSQQNLANMAWAFGKLSHFAPSLLDAVAKQALSMAQELSLQHVTNILWTYASFLHPVPGFYEALLAEIRRRLAQEQFNAQQLSNMLWSLCILQRCTQDEWRELLTQFGSLGIAPGDLPEEALTQVYQSYLLMLVDQPGVDLAMPAGLRETAKSTWVASRKNVRVSWLHKDVSRVLKEMGLDHDIEHVTQDQLFSVDISLKGEQVAIEADGPHHFTSNTRMPLGEMKARARLLNARGWQVISVPFFNWTGHTDAHHKALLRQV